MLKKLIPAAIAASTLLLPLAGYAQTTGTDNAGNYTGDYNGKNLGTGFGTFTVTGSANNPAGVGYAGSYVGTSGTTIDTGGKSFGLYANGATPPTNAVVTITRPFATSLQNAGDSFSAVLNTNFLNSTTGQSFVFNVGPETLTLTSAGYSLAGGTVLSNLTPSDNILNTTFIVGAANKYTFTVTGSTAGDVATATGTLSGPVSQFQIVGTNLPHDQFFNSLSVTNVAAPEPGSVVSFLIGAGVLGGSLLVRRRRSA